MRDGFTPRRKDVRLAIVSCLIILLMAVMFVKHSRPSASNSVKKSGVDDSTLERKIGHVICDPSGGSTTQVFHITNSTPAVVNLKLRQKSCTCVSVFPESIILKGMQGVDVKVTGRLSPDNGPQRFQACYEVGEVVKCVAFSVTPHSAFSVEPNQRLTRFKISENKSVESSFVVTSRSPIGSPKPPRTIVSFDGVDAQCKLVTEQRESKNEMNVWKETFTINFPFEQFATDSSEHSAKVVFSNSSLKIQRKLHFSHEAEVRCKPSSVFLRVSSSKQSSTKKLTLVSDKLFTITDFHTSNERLEFKFANGNVMSKNHSIVVSYSPKHPLEPFSQKSSVTIDLQGETNSKIRIPVFILATDDNH